MASLHNNTEPLKFFGATHVLDRRLSPSALIAAVAHITPASVQIVYDAATLQDAQNAAYDVLASGGAMIIVLDDAVDPAKKTEDKTIVDVFRNTHTLHNRKTAARLYVKITSLLQDGLIKPNRIEA